jgi:formylglycine-generating enzyme required for sulfatase activity
MPNPQISIRLSPALYENLLTQTESLAATKSDAVGAALAQCLQLFVMGASSTEKGALPQELPSHDVQILPFALGKLTINQAQWRIMAQFPLMKSD